MVDSSHRSDVLIIGSGISALTCAAILARKGKKVRVLEQHRKPGGYLHCFSRFGVRFDTGAHFVGALDPGQPFHALLHYAGAYDSKLFVPLDPDGFDSLRFPGLTVDLPKGYAETIRRLSGIFPGEAGAIEAFYARTREVAASFPTYEFSDETDNELMLRMLETPLEAVVTGLTSNPALQSVLYAYCSLHGVRPSEISFGLHSLVTDSLIRGPYGLREGGDGLADAYVTSIQRLGGEVLLKRKVLRIEVREGRAQAALTADGERFEAEWIVSSAHPKTTFSLLSDSSALTPAFRERLGKMRETDGVFGIYAACERKPDLNPLRNYHYFTSMKPAELFAAPVPGLPPSTVFLSSAERVVSEASRPVALNIHAVSPASWFEPWRESHWGKRPDGYEDYKAAYAERVLRVIDRLHPGIVETIGRSATSTPLSNLHFNGSPEGSPYGIYHSMANTGARALGPRTHVQGLLLTGQSCLLPGLLGSAISGLRSAGHIVGIKPILKELSQLRQEA